MPKLFQHYCKNFEPNSLKRRSTKVCILTWCFVGGQIYEIALFGNIAGGAEGSSKRRVQINEPPEKGTCTAKPPEGTPMDPMFTLNCTGFKDVEKPLHYEFFYSTNGEDKITLGSGLEDFRSKVTLPSGLIKLYAKVSDNLGASTEVEFQLQLNVSSLVAGRRGRGYSEG